MPGTTNFIPINIPQVNMESDPSYAADAFTATGIAAGTIVPSNWLNKVLYQCAMFVAAFSQMMTEKNYSPFDTNLNNLTAVLANVLTRFDIPAPIKSIPFASNMTFDAQQSLGFDITLNGDVVASSLVNTQPGQTLTFVLRQDSSGGHNFIPPFNVINFPAFNSTPNSVTIVAFYVTYDGTIRPYTPAQMS